MYSHPEKLFLSKEISQHWDKGLMKQVSSFEKKMPSIFIREKKDEVRFFKRSNKSVRYRTFKSDNLRIILF